MLSGFRGTHEKQLDAKRRLLIPADFRAAASTADFEGVWCFPSFEADCIEGGGQALIDQYERQMEELPYGDPLRNALQTSVFAGLTKLTFDDAGRILLPEPLRAMFGIGVDVVIAGLKDRFQIWSQEAWRAQFAEQRAYARREYAAWRNAQRAAKAGGGA